MTVQTPLHVQTVLPPCQGHLVHLAMTRDTAHTLIDVDAVIEIDEIRKAIHPIPFDGSVTAETRSDGLEHRGIGPNLRVTIHAGFCRRQSRKRTLLNRGVTVTAVDSQASN